MLGVVSACTFSAELLCVGDALRLLAAALPPISCELWRVLIVSVSPSLPLLLEFVFKMWYRLEDACVWLLKLDRDLSTGDTRFDTPYSTFDSETLLPWF
jgi:hypothetical protein